VSLLMPRISSEGTFFDFSDSWAGKYLYQMHRKDHPLSAILCPTAPIGENGTLNIPSGETVQIRSLKRTRGLSSAEGGRLGSSIGRWLGIVSGIRLLARWQ
jgi:hypothetical protein